MQTWKPNIGPQLKALQTTAYETLYGGARGGGKTDAGLVWLVKPYLLENPNVRSLVIRKNGDDLADWIDRATRLYSRYGAIVTGKPAVIRFPSGYKIRTGHLKDDQAYTKYQGQEYQRMVIEELTQIAQETNYIKLLGSCRSTIKGVDARMFCTTNPGGVGHRWVKERFVDPEAPNTKFIGHDTDRTRIFIPARIEDNPELQENDPDYVKFLEGLKNTDVELYKAWRLGDWDTFAGQFFREFRRDLHVVRPFVPRGDIPRVGGLDWGRTDPFCFLGAVVVKVKYTGKDKTNPFDDKIRGYTFNRVFLFQEAYGTDQLPKHWAEIIDLKCPIGNVTWIACDNQIFNKADTDHSTSIAQQFYDYDPQFYGKMQPASKERVIGWENVHNWLSIAPDGKPYLLIGENCVNLIRTLPMLVHDENKVEDIDEAGEDHAPDALRYLLKALQWIDAKLGAVNHSSFGPVSKAERIKGDSKVRLDAWNE